MGGLTALEAYNNEFFIIALVGVIQPISTVKGRQQEAALQTDALAATNQLPKNIAGCWKAPS